MLFDALKSSDYLAFLPSRLFTDRADRLKMLHIDVDSQQFDVVANWHPRMNGDAQHKWLHAQFVDVADQG